MPFFMDIWRSVSTKEFVKIQTGEDYKTTLVKGIVTLGTI